MAKLMSADELSEALAAIAIRAISSGRSFGEVADAFRKCADRLDKRAADTRRSVQ